MPAIPDSSLTDLPVVDSSSVSKKFPGAAILVFREMVLAFYPSCPPIRCVMSLQCERISTINPWLYIKEGGVQQFIHQIRFKILHILIISMKNTEKFLIICVKNFNIFRNLYTRKFFFKLQDDILFLCSRVQNFGIRSSTSKNSWSQD